MSIEVSLSLFDARYEMVWFVFCQSKGADLLCLSTQKPPEGKPLKIGE